MNINIYILIKYICSVGQSIRQGAAAFRAAARGPPASVRPRRAASATPKGGAKGAGSKASGEVCGALGDVES